MKKIISILIGFILFKNTYAQNNFIIKGIINKEYEGASIQFHNDSYETKANQFTEVKNGQFIIKGTSKNLYDYCSLSFSKDGKYYSTYFFICKGNFSIKVKKLNLNNKMNSIEYINFPLMKEYEEYKSLMQPYKIKDDDLYIQLKNSEKIKPYSQTIDSLESLRKDWKRKSTTESIDFIKKYKDSYLAFYSFKTDVIPKTIHPDTLENIFSLFKYTFRISDEGKEVEQIIKNKKSMALGSILPNFWFITQDSIEYNLYDFRDKKFVLLCCWATWCVPCIEGFPVFRNINDSFGNKNLQMISIAFDDEVNHWKSALKKYGLPWLQTTNLKEFMPGENIKKQYDINFLPQYFLIDKEGRLVYHNVQNNDDNSYTILKSLLSKVLNR